LDLSPIKGTVKVRVANVRFKPNGTVIGKLTQNEPIIVKYHGDGWFKIVGTSFRFSCKYLKPEQKTKCVNDQTYTAYIHESVLNI